VTYSQEIGTVFVTGGSSGLGAAVAAAVAKAGGTPAVIDQVPPEEGVAHSLADLADSAAAERAVADLIEQVGEPSAVVTAAGTDVCGPLSEVDRESWERVVKVNLLGTASVVRACLPALERGGGRIVTVGSTLGLKAVGDATAYCASKFGVVGFTRALAAELAGRVGVTMLVPGGMRTAFFAGRPEQYRPAADAELMDPADVAGAVLVALQQPPDCVVRELVVTPSVEPSWP
jgi:NAD(P)-dependent dehydrogenase (short-subunit alcohol dehydrogenase family)